MARQPKLRIVAIDKESLSSILDHEGFKQHGCEVVRTDSFAKLDMELKRRRCDICLVNYDNFEPDPIQTIHYLKNVNPLSVKLPLVVTSVQAADSPAAQSALQHGADLYVEQPIQRDHLVEKIRQLVDLKTRQHHRFSGPEIQGLPVNCVSVGEAPITASIQTISISGAFLRTEQHFATGDEIALDFDVPLQDGTYQKVCVRGEIIHNYDGEVLGLDNGLGVGVKFRAFSKGDRKRLQSFLEAIRGESLDYYS